jgi:hypothetical protein
MKFIEDIRFSIICLMPQGGDHRATSNSLGLRKAKAHWNVMLGSF